MNYICQSVLYLFTLSVWVWLDRQETVPSAFSWGPGQGMCVRVCRVHSITKKILFSTLMIKTRIRHCSTLNLVSCHQFIRQAFMFSCFKGDADFPGGLKGFNDESSKLTLSRWQACCVTTKMSSVSILSSHVCTDGRPDGRQSGQLILAGL